MPRNPEPHVTVKIDQNNFLKLREQKEAQDAVNEAADLVVDEAKRTVHVVTGNLRDHIEKRPSSDGVSVDIGVFEGADYADIEEERHPYLRPALNAAKGKHYGTR